MRVLGIESSCDETAAAVVEDGRRLLSNVVHSQIDLHAVYGGVVPEIAARSHLEVINPVIERAVKEAGNGWQDIDAIAVTYAPGLVGSLLVGTLTARTLALVKRLPLYAVHHVEAHVYANFITEANPAIALSGTLPDRQPTFPLLALIVSGGHTQLVLFHDHGRYELIGQTMDDAVGEAFDKVAKILGLSYPGGPSVARSAEQGDPLAFKLPLAKMTGEFDFSFSGLKTAVLRAVQNEAGVDITFPSNGLHTLLDEPTRNNFAASFQYTAVKTLVNATLRAYRRFNPASVVIAGGVAANRQLRQELAKALPVNINYAPPELCTDNAAMVAALGSVMLPLTKPVSPMDLEVIPSLSMRQTSWRTL